MKIIKLIMTNRRSTGVEQIKILRIHNNTAPRLATRGNVYDQ